MSIEIIHPTMADLIDPSAQLDRIGDGFKFTEGPVWHKEQQCLYFSDIPANILYKWTEQDGFSAHREPSQNTNGLTINAKGQLISCEHSGRRVSIEIDGSVETLTSTYQGKRLNSPNDVIVCQNGDLIFTDPPYGLPKKDGVMLEQEIDFFGVYRLPAGSSEPVLLIDDFERPNGLAISADEKTLYVDDTARKHIRAFNVEPDGSISNGRIFAELIGEGKGAPDGMKLDRHDNVFCTGAGGVWVFNANGDVLGKIHTDNTTANIGWGGEDMQTLFLTASTEVYRVQCKTGA
ncbi:MAG: SMP-30/gluconolactonase/LRE family protein [Candidatus Latescibacteria bacterium]|nr:SMP-30/gluconolactonase/LRE family protein [Candidatus Latescibacterota bacterium]